MSRQETERGRKRERERERERERVSERKRDRGREGERERENIGQKNKTYIHIRYERMKMLEKVRVGVPEDCLPVNFMFALDSEKLIHAPVLRDASM